MQESEVQLLRAAMAAGGRLTWADAQSRLGVTHAELQLALRPLVKNGLLRLANGENRKPHLQLTEKGADELVLIGRASSLDQFRSMRITRPLLVFVALEEELRVLVRRWQLSQRSVDDPTWNGEIVPGFEVNVLPAYGAGRVRAAVETLDYLHSTSDRLPDLAVVIGICGGFAEADSVAQGDVIVAESIADLGTRKMRSGPDGSAPEFRIEPFIADDRVSKALRGGVFDRAQWQQDASQEFEYPPGRVPVLRFGTLVCVDEVVSSNQWRKGLLNAWPKALGVEMEAGGVMAACQRKRVPVAVIRGVSDLANPLKADDQWRSRSIKAAALALESAVALLVPA